MFLLSGNCNGPSDGGAERRRRVGRACPVPNYQTYISWIMPSASSRKSTEAPEIKA